jgi:hypothetical protein
MARTLWLVRWRRIAALAGLAGLAGVAATGVAVARDERRRQAYTPDEVRNRLHERLAKSDTPESHDKK